MNKVKLTEEGKKWVDDGLITGDQLEGILARYSRRDPNIIIILFAVLLTGLGFVTFIMSDWAQVPHISRILIILAFVIGLYVLGNYLYVARSKFLGISFITLGYIVFGAGLFLAINIYQVQLFNAWPFIVWSFIGLGLYFIYRHSLLLAVGILIATIGQIYSGVGLSHMDWFLLGILLLGYGHFVYHFGNKWIGYIFSLCLSVHLLILATDTAQPFYWLVAYYLVVYILAGFIRKHDLKMALTYLSLLSAFVFTVYQTFALREDFIYDDNEKQIGFLIVWFVLIAIGLIIKFKQNRKLEMMDLILFIPFFYLPFPATMALIFLFVFSLYWLLVGFKVEDGERIFVGTIAFLFSTFTAYIQYAWDAMNKSLFFFIGGLLLFGLSYLIEKQRRKVMHDHKGGSKS